MLLLAGCAGTNKEEDNMTNTQVATLSEFDKDLSGKRVLFIGDSFLFTGRAVLQNKEVTEEGRRYDTGYFYQLCKAKGFSDVEVVNWTYGGAGLQTIMDSYVPLFRDRDFDYVILSGGRNSANKIADLENTLDQYIEAFSSVNPNVKFFYLVTSGAHNISVKESFSIDVLNNLEKIEAKGIKVLDWGKLVADIVRGETEVPGGTLTYDKYSFVHNKSLTDGYHPNQLSGYIVSMFVYCAITGESAVGLPYDFWDRSDLHKQFDPTVYANTNYTLGPSNYQEIFRSPADMEGLQKLVDQYMAEKAYLTYNFTEVPVNPENNIQ